MNDKVYIYVLKEAGSADVKYVGQTVNPEMRLTQHIGSSKLNIKNRKERWIWELMQAGSRIELSVIEECPDCDAASREVFWIKHYIDNGHILTNAIKHEQNLASIRRKHSSSDKPKRKEQARIEHCPVNWPTEHITSMQLAEKLRVHIRIIQRLIRDGKLPAVRVGKEYRISVEDFEKFLSEGKERKQ